MVIAQQARVYGYTIEAALLGNILWHDLSDVYMMLLTDSYSPDQDVDEYYTGAPYGINANEIPATGGYIAGGKILTGLYISYSSGTTPGGTVQLRCDPITWTGLTTANVKYAVLYYKGAGVGIYKPLIGYIQFDQTLAPANEDLTIQPLPTGLVNLSLSTVATIPVTVTSRAYGSFMQAMFEQLVIWTGSADVKMMLLTSSYNPNQDLDSVYNDIKAYEIANGAGYTTGGIAMTNLSIAYFATAGIIPGGESKLLADNVVFTGLTKADIRTAVIYNDVGTKPLIGYIMFDTTKAPVAENLTVTFTGGIAMRLLISNV